MVCLFWHSMYTAVKFNANHQIIIINSCKFYIIRKRMSYSIRICKIFEDASWFCKSHSFSHSVKTTSIDHIAVLADNNNTSNGVRIHFLKSVCHRNFYKKTPLARQLFSWAPFALDVSQSASTSQIEVWWAILSEFYRYACDPGLIY